MLSSTIEEIEALRPLFVELPDPVQVIFCLFVDAAHLFKVAGPPAPDVHRRNFVRGAFAFIDGASYVLKQFALAQCAVGQAKYDAVEIAFLKDEARLPTGDESRAGFPRMDDNFFFAVKLVMQPWCPGLVINKTHVGWQKFKTALKVRHRVTHPKKHRWTSNK